MAIDPSINLQARVPDITPAINIFQNALTQKTNRRLAEAQNARAEQKFQQQQALQPLRNQILQQQVSQQGVEGLNLRDARRIKSLTDFSANLKPALQRAVESGDSSEVLRRLNNRRSDLLRRQEAGEEVNTQDTDEAIQMVQQGNTQNLLNVTTDLLNSPLAQQNQRRLAPKSFAPRVDPESGQLFIPTFDANTQTVTNIPVPDAIQETPAQKRIAEAELTASGETAKLRARRVSEVKKEFGDRRRQAARSQRPLRQALKLAEKASQGLGGTARLQLSRLIPGIDATSEAALDATLNQLALEQLQQFKGPTTDFEFGVTQTIAGSLGQSKASNQARIKSLDRANWFNNRESQQFDKHVKAGGDPEDFAFDFNEKLKTKKGFVSLQDIQDTAVDNSLTIEETLKRLNK